MEGVRRCSDAVRYALNKRFIRFVDDVEAISATLTIMYVRSRSSPPPKVRVKQLTISPDCAMQKLCNLKDKIQDP